MDKSKEAASLFDKWAQYYQDKYFDVSQYAAPLDFFCNRLEKPNAELLELACGPGNVSSYVLKKRPDLRLLGTDLSENMVQLARQNNPGAEFVVMDSREINNLGKKYDGIIISFLLPYLTYNEVSDLVGDCTEVLADGGLIYISTIEGEHASSGPQQSSKGDMVFMHYYQSFDLRGFFEMHGLSVIHESKVSTVMANGVETTDLIFVVKKSG